MPDTEPESSKPQDQSETPPLELSPEDAQIIEEARKSWSNVPRARVAGTELLDPDLEVSETRGSQLGAKYVRIVRSKEQGFEKRAPGWLEATSRATEPLTPFARFRKILRTILLGPPLATRQLVHERLTKIKALAVLSSDALSSVAYGPEQILVVFLIIGNIPSAEHTFALPILAVILCLLAAVIMSYRQTIRAYPKGGGSYIVAKDNLGPTFGLIAASALMTDYVLTVAVSVSSGIAQVVSAFPGLTPYIVPICVGIILLIAIANLRGLREAGNIFALPTYLFLIALFVMVFIVLFRYFTGACAHHMCIAIATQNTPYPVAVGAVGTVSLWLLLQSFASGSSSLTGIEAISDGVPAFKPPEWKNARTTITIMGGLLGAMLIGIGISAHLLGIEAFNSASSNYQTLISQLAHVASWDLPGHTPGIFYFFTVAVTTLILVLAANTAFSDFPRLLFFLARDEYAPHQFKRLGDRLAFSNGIVVLSSLSIVLIIIFRGVTDALIPLYAIGVFLAFTLSQAGMVVRWWKRRERGWKRSLPISTLGMIATATVFIIEAVVKFRNGAWVVLIIIPSLFALFMAIHRHYKQVNEILVNELPTSPSAIKPICIVPIASFNSISLQSLALARTMSDNVVAVHVCDDEEHIAKLRLEWDAWGNHVPLEIIESPYRNMLRPLLAYIDAIDRQHKDDTIVVLLPELIATRWWHQILHNQSALRLKALLFFRPGTIVIDVPYHIGKKRKTGIQSSPKSHVDHEAI